MEMPEAKYLPAKLICAGTNFEYRVHCIVTFFISTVRRCLSLHFINETCRSPKLCYRLNSGSLPSISVDFKVTGVSTTKCSVYGGCYVSITGSGFPENKDITQISFGRAPCKINSLSSTQVQCQIDIARKVWFVDNSGIHPGGLKLTHFFLCLHCEFCREHIHCYHCSDTAPPSTLLFSDNLYELSST